MRTDELIQKIKKNWKVKVICILIAVIIYIICQIAFLDKKSFSVVPQIKNLSNLSFSNNIPRWVRISVRGIPAEIDSLEGKDFDVYLDLSNYAEPGLYKVPLMINYSERVSNIEKLEISVEPDFIELHLEPNVTTLVPLKSNIIGTCANGYEISSYELSPDFAQISGIKSIVEKTSYLETSPVNVNGKSSDFTQKVNIINKNSRLTLSDIKETNLSVKIIPIKITKQFESSEIFYYSLKDIFSVENSNISYKITLSGNKNELEKFVLSPLTVQVDCSSIESIGTYDLPLKVIVPDGITVDKIEPEYVQINVVDFVEKSIPQTEEVASDNSSPIDSEEKSEIVNTEELNSEDNLSLPIPE